MSCALEKALSHYHGKKIRIISKLGKKDQGLLKICENNTKFSFNKGSRSKRALPALKSLKEELDLSKEIKVVESYDISHHSSSAAVGGCVVFSERGKLTDKYKNFIGIYIRSECNNDIKNIRNHLSSVSVNNTPYLDGIWQSRKYAYLSKVFPSMR